MPTQHPYLYGISASVAEGQTLSAVEEVVLGEIDRLCADGITPDELKKVHAQLRARFVYDGDSVTDIAHQIGYFETIASWPAYHALRRAPRRGDGRAGAGRGGEIPDAVESHDRLVRAAEVADSRSAHGISSARSWRSVTARRVP